MRRITFTNNEIYHVYNRGTDKRTIFEDEYDFQRFLQSLKEFNTPESIGSIYEHTRLKKEEFGHPTSKLEGGLVEIIAYCLNKNHFHLLLKQVADQGVQKFMQRLGNGYTKYFNHKYKRSGVLFQGKYKAVYVDTNEYLLHLSVYVGLNNKVHRFGHRMSKSSWREYMGEIKKEDEICIKDMVLGQFGNSQEYEAYAKSTLQGIQEKKLLAQEPF